MGRKTDGRLSCLLCVAKFILILRRVNLAEFEINCPAHRRSRKNPTARPSSAATIKNPPSSPGGVSDLLAIETSSVIIGSPFSGIVVDELLMCRSHPNIPGKRDDECTNETRIRRIENQQEKWHIDSTCCRQRVVGPKLRRQIGQLAGQRRALISPSPSPRNICNSRQT
jgi:hypothetical protein